MSFLNLNTLHVPLISHLWNANISEADFDLPGAAPPPVIATATLEASHSAKLVAPHLVERLDVSTSRHGCTAALPRKSIPPPELAFDVQRCPVKTTKAEDV